MAKFLLKSMFGYAVLGDMQPGEEVKVACQTMLECKSIKSLASQYKGDHPRPDVSRYPVSIEQQGDGYIVTVTAVK
jgi:hypothetical protein